MSEDSKYRAFVVEDDASYMRALRKVMSKFWGGRIVLEAESAPEALSYIPGQVTEAGVHIAVVDVDLGDQRGRDVAQALRSEAADVPILAMSSFDPDDYRDEGAWADDFVDKSVGIQAIGHAISSLLLRMRS